MAISTSGSVLLARTRSGFATPPGAGVGQFAAPAKPVPLDTLLANPQLPMTLFEDSFFMQATMFQPVGGMDRIAVAIEGKPETQRAIRAMRTCGVFVRSQMV